MKIKLLTCISILLCLSSKTMAWDVSYQLMLKQPGNAAVVHQLSKDGNQLKAAASLPVEITQQVERKGEVSLLTLTLTARERVYFNLGVSMQTGMPTDDCDFYLPGFWYHKNLRSPKEAPSFHTSRSWNFREDRLAAPLTAVYNGQSGTSCLVMRQLDASADALTTHQEGEVILGGPTSIGYLGFDNEQGSAALTFGYPYMETPKRYIRKLTLAPSMTAFARLEKGERKTLTWLVREGKSADYGQFVADTWRWAFDQLHPQPLQPLYSPEQVKAQLANYFRQAYVDRYALKYHSGLSIRCDDCLPVDHVQLGFCGRVLLNAFNSLEYGEQTGEQRLVETGQAIFDSWLQHGFTAKGWLKDEMRIANGIPADADVVHSIREQSEAVYAVLHYLAYEKRHGRQHRQWEQRVRTLLNNMLELQKADGHFPRMSYTSEHNRRVSDFWLGDASYMRLKNIQLSYTLPDSWSRKMGLKRLTLFANADNLFTFTNFYQGYDPEVAYNSSATNGVAMGAVCTQVLGRMQDGGHLGAAFAVLGVVTALALLVQLVVLKPTTDDMV